MTDNMQIPNKLSSSFDHLEKVFCTPKFAKYENLECRPGKNAAMIIPTSYNYNWVNFFRIGIDKINLELIVSSFDEVKIFYNYNGFDVHIQAAYTIIDVLSTREGKLTESDFMFNNHLIENKEKKKEIEKEDSERQKEKKEILIEKQFLTKEMR